MSEKTVDVIIPAYKPGKEFGTLLKRLEKQEYPVNRIIVMNTEEAFWDSRWEQECPILEVYHVRKSEFDHGGTRKKGASLSKADIMVFMTQDAFPADAHLISNLIRTMEKEPSVAAAYGRQLPREDCSYVEKYTRSFNYPSESFVKTKADLPKLGIKTFFCSNVCAAYKKDVFEKLGGFVEKTIFNEDMIYAGGLIKAGYGIAYEAGARVIHSHNYTCMQQFRRNFDLGVSQAQYPEIFESVPSEGEGIRLVKKTFAHLLKKGKIWLIPGFVMQSGFKYAGYLAGKRYRKLSQKMILRCTMSPSYWEK